MPRVRCSFFSAPRGSKCPVAQTLEVAGAKWLPTRSRAFRPLSRKVAPLVPTVLLKPGETTKQNQIFGCDGFLAHLPARHQGKALLRFHVARNLCSHGGLSEMKRLSLSLLVVLLASAFTLIPSLNSSHPRASVEQPAVSLR